MSLENIAVVQISLIVTHCTCNVEANAYPVNMLFNVERKGDKLYYTCRINTAFCSYIITILLFMFVERLYLFIYLFI